MIAAGTPLKVTWVAGDRLRPRMVTVVPGGPEAGALRLIPGVTLVVIRPIVLLAGSVNHIAPSGPATTSDPSAGKPETGKLVTLPAVVIRPIPPASVNHRAPSGPAATAPGSEMLGAVKLERRPVGGIRPMSKLLG